MDYILTTQNLTKKYGKNVAIEGVDLHVKEGEIYGLIGRNGAGKTTIMRIISGLSKATTGTYEIHDDSKLGVGVLIESPGLYPTMTAEENIRLKCVALGCYEKGYADKILETVGLENAKNKKPKSFSLGMRQRLGIALALAGDPKMIVLDEPINGLDPQGIVEVRQTLERLKEEKGITIMISSHILDELSKFADSFGIIHQGKMIDEFITEELAERCGQYVMLSVDDNERAVKVVKHMGYDDVTIDSDGHVRVANALHDTIAINKALVKNDVGVREMTVKNTSLEDYYLSMTGGN